MLKKNRLEFNVSTYRLCLPGKLAGTVEQVVCSDKKVNVVQCWGSLTNMIAQPLGILYVVLSSK